MSSSAVPPFARTRIPTGPPPSGGPPAVVVSGLSFAWPDGSVVFEGLDLAIGAGRTGLIGANGSGKSTLLRLVAGAAEPGGLVPTAGSVRVTGELAYLPQEPSLQVGVGVGVGPRDADPRVDQVLGIARVRSALAALARGDTGTGAGGTGDTGTGAGGTGDTRAGGTRAGHPDPVDLEALLAVVGDDWDIEERARATLDRLGLAGVGLDRPVGELSGGEAVLVALAARFLRRPGVLLLDEPTNNLDRTSRQALYAAVAAYPGVLVVVSHDRELLDAVDQVAELRDGTVNWFGGNLSAYEEALAVEQEAARRAVRAAEGDVRRQRRELADARIKLDRRVRYGQKMWDNKREPKIIMSARKRQAQVSAGKHRGLHQDRLAAARERLSEAAEAVRDDAEIRVDLPRTAVPAGRDVVRLADVVLRCGPRVSLAVRGPERIALVGANGAGKTTLLRTIAGQLAPRSGRVRLLVPARYLPQRLDLLDDALTVAQNAAAGAPGTPDNEIRARLARFLFRGDRADRVVGTLSGGERFRAALAALLLAEPPPQLLMLDEPTNNLDLASIRQLELALAAYRGALIIASHDVPLLRAARVDRWLRLGDGALTETDPE